MQEPSLKIPIAIAIGGIVVAGAVYFTMRAQEPSTASGHGNPALVRPVDSSDHIFGNPAAPVKIVEYADLYCEYCQGFSNTLEQVVANAGAKGSVAWVFREFPLYEIHPNAEAGAEAAECVAQTGGNDAFWKFENLMFEKQPVDPAQYGALAQQAGAPGNAFATCYTNASSTVAARVSADRQNALDTGAAGTPYSLILVNGKAPVVMDGAYSYDAVMQLVNQALRGAQ